MASVWVEKKKNGRFKVCWRELVAGPDGQPARNADGRLRHRRRAVTVVGRHARDEKVAQVRQALAAEGEYQLPTATDEPVVANLEQAALAWLAWKRTRCKTRTVVTYTNHMKRFFELVRELKGMQDQDLVLAPVLSRGLLIDCIRTWQERGYSEAWVYACGRSVIDMWRWVSDDPDAYPGVPIPPREAKRILPRVPVYVAPPAPKVAELDACLRHISPDAVESRRIGSVLRFTGLRISQVLALKREHVDLEQATLQVTVGKSRQEEAEQRVIPISRHLAADMASWLGDHEADDFIFPAWGSRRQRPANVRATTFHDAWAEATERGEARRVVWDPSNRKIARPQHAFRAGFQAFLRSERVAEEVIDALVGHHGRSLRARHYAGPDTLWDRMREAVDLLPVIDWQGPKAVKSRSMSKVLEFPGA